MKRKKSFFAVCLLSTLLVAGCGEEKPYTEEPSAASPTVAQSGEVTVTTVPESSEQKTDELKYSFLEERNEADDGEMTYFTSSIVYPAFTTGNGVEDANRFVESLLAEFRLYLPEAEESAKLDYEEFKSGEYPDFMFPEVQEYTVSVPWQNAETLVLYVQNYSSTGGAHPNVFGMAYVINKADGSRMESETVLAKYGLTVGETAEYAAERIREKDGEALYVTDSESMLTEWVTEFLEGNGWYLTENGLVIFANPYDIAPYAYGVIECEISYEELEQGLKKD